MNPSPSREQSRIIVLMLSVPNRFRLMFGQPFLPGDPGVERYLEALKERRENEKAEKPKQQPTNE